MGSCFGLDSNLKRGMQLLFALLVPPQPQLECGDIILVCRHATASYFITGLWPVFFGHIFFMQKNGDPKVAELTHMLNVSGQSIMQLALCSLAQLPNRTGLAFPSSELPDSCNHIRCRTIRRGLPDYREP